MVKKIVLVGSSSAGKSTLRKWFFEGENIFKLLENPLEPTISYENKSYRFIQKLYVFDLAGQEFDRWFGEQQDIFDESEVIINVIDARSAPKIITDYIIKALPLQSSRVKDADIFFLIHKVDLIDTFQQDKIKKALNDLKRKKNEQEEMIFNWYFTSIKPSYLVSTINAFADIFKISGLDREAKLNTKLIRLNTELFQMLSENQEVSMENLSLLLKGTYSKIHSLVTSYKDSGLLETKEKNGKIIISLTKKGESYYEQVIKSIELLFKEELHERISEEVPFEEKIQTPSYWIYGIMISDSNGRTLLIAETSDNSLKSILNQANNPQFDLELIPMFLNAMSKFAEEINVKNLSSFQIQGGNLQMSSLSRGNITFTVFSNPEFKIELVQDEITVIFDEFFDNYIKYIKEFEKTGNATPFMEFIPTIKEKIELVIKNYIKIIKEISYFSFDEVKRLYDELSHVNEDKLTLEEQLKIKSLKVKLLETILAENARDFLAMEEEIRSCIK
ncbi:ADP-ribosylation factor-like protein [Candidatus Harpocratesius sp.]